MGTVRPELVGPAMVGRVGGTALRPNERHTAGVEHEHGWAGHRRGDPHPSETNYNLKKDEEEFDAYRKQWTGKLRGKIVLVGDSKPPAEQSKPQFKRYTDAELAEIGAAPEHVAKNYGKLADLKWPDDREEFWKFLDSLPEATVDEWWHALQGLQNKRSRFFLDEGVLGLLIRDDRAHAGMTFAEQAGSQKSADPLAPPAFVVTAEQYNRIARVLEKKVPVKVRVSLKANLCVRCRRRQHRGRNSRWQQER